MFDGNSSWIWIIVVFTLLFGWGNNGSGLGLSIAKSFTEASGGAFRVETMADLFTAVVTFPLSEE